MVWKKSPGPSQAPPKNAMNTFRVADIRVAGRVGGMVKLRVVWRTAVGSLRRQVSGGSRNLAENLTNSPDCPSRPALTFAREDMDWPVARPRPRSDSQATRRGQRFRVR